MRKYLFLTLIAILLACSQTATGPYVSEDDFEVVGDTTSITVDSIPYYSSDSKPFTWSDSSFIDTIVTVVEAESVIVITRASSSSLDISTSSSSESSSSSEEPVIVSSSYEVEMSSCSVAMESSSSREVLERSSSSKAVESSNSNQSVVSDSLVMNYSDIVDSSTKEVLDSVLSVIESGDTVAGYEDVKDLTISNTELNDESTELFCLTEDGNWRMIDKDGLEVKLRGLWNLIVYLFTGKLYYEFSESCEHLFIRRI